MAALAWALVVQQAASGMGMPAGMPASGDAMGVPVPGGFGSFLGIWTAMMAAMMLPSVAPVASVYLSVVRSGARGLLAAVRVVALVGGYLGVWAGFGVAAFAAAREAASLTDRAPTVMAWVAAAVFAVAGLYQFTRLKAVCLRHCRSPLGFLLHFGNYAGRLRDVRVGLYHGGYCVGCCWSLMLVLVAMGVMNMVWMVGLAGVVFLEKTWRHGKRFSLAVGVALLALAAVVPWHPGLVGLSLGM